MGKKNKIYYGMKQFLVCRSGVVDVLLCGTEVGYGWVERVDEFPEDLFKPLVVVVKCCMSFKMKRYQGCNR